MSNIMDFVASYQDIYDAIYTAQAAGRTVKGYDEAVSAFDAKDYPVTVLKDYCKAVQDFISSDREAAAFVMTCRQFGLC